MSDIDAGEAAGPGLRILVASHLGKRAEGTPDHEEVADLGETLDSEKRWRCYGPILRRLRPISVPGVLEP
jgi:hypothetical protein